MRGLKIFSRHDPLDERLLSKRKIDANGCWLWTGTLKRGYGAITFKYKQLAVHRVAFQLFNGPIKDGMSLDHLCCNKRCFNPMHLEQCTRAENIRRYWGPSYNPKTHCANGHPITEENTYFAPKRPKTRECRICRNLAAKKYRNNNNRSLTP